MNNNIEKIAVESTLATSETAKKKFLEQLHIAVDNLNDLIQYASIVGYKITWDASTERSVSPPLEEDYGYLAAQVENDVIIFDI